MVGKLTHIYTRLNGGHIIHRSTYIHIWTATLAWTKVRWTKLSQRSFPYNVASALALALLLGDVMRFWCDESHYVGHTNAYWAIFRGDEVPTIGCRACRAHTQLFYYWHSWGWGGGGVWWERRKHCSSRGRAGRPDRWHQPDWKQKKWKELYTLYKTPNIILKNEHTCILVRCSALWGERD